MHRLAEGPDNSNVQIAYFFLHPQNCFPAQRPPVFKLPDNL